MRRIKFAALTLLVLAIIISIALFVLGYLKPKVAGIFIETSPSATVFINGEQVGRTPYRQTYEPGEFIIKLIPESFEKPLAPYETRINLVEGVETVVRRDFGESESMSAGEVVSFEKIDSSQTSLVVVSVPDSAQLVVDGFQKSVTPYKTSSVSAGDHTLTLTSEGYVDRHLSIKTHKGYKLTAVVQLALGNSSFEEEISPTPEETAEEVKPEVEILSTSTGFLRVRDEPSTLGNEIGQVNPGETYTLIDEDEKTGWYEIEFGKDMQGWISNTYAKKLEEDSSSSATSSSVLSPTP